MTTCVWFFTETFWKKSTRSANHQRVQNLRASVCKCEQDLREYASNNPQNPAFCRLACSLHRVTSRGKHPSVGRQKKPNINRQNSMKKFLAMLAIGAAL